ncbi:MAG: hypothetical protein HXY43_02795 [Fischerella sp.]|uniref:hypothetical protein n=1 Tax=Fischerella sp. TaxID=1191 RepID=UPI0017C984D9|nr:hypothetical protein [Fischerella sp.]NWF58261.1 hypothetical protein [Fischerella sp.]
MARPIERIERDLAVLEEAIAAIAQELKTAYVSYLATLGQAVRQQLILAVYHLCTQRYSENFLKLSLSQRQNLQQSVRKLGQQAAEQLLALINNDAQQPSHKQVESDTVDEWSQSLIGISSLMVAGVESEDEQKNEEGEENEENEENANFSLSPSYPVFPSSSNPIELAKWQQYIERSAQGTLRKISRETNLLLQKAKILPKQLPEPILEAAGSDASAEVVPAPPNLLNLVIEIENEQEPEESSLTQIMAINLRLVEIEFADTKLSSERKQIRNILAQLNKLGLDYQKKQRELSVAEAEAAWRASWFED